MVEPFSFQTREWSEQFLIWCARFVYLTKRKENKEAKKGSGARLSSEHQIVVIVHAPDSNIDDEKNKSALSDKNIDVFHNNAFLMVLKVL